MSGEGGSVEVEDVGGYVSGNGVRERWVGAVGPVVAVKGGAVVICGPVWVGRGGRC